MSVSFPINKLLNRTVLLLSGDCWGTNWQANNPTVRWTLCNTLGNWWRISHRVISVRHLLGRRRRRLLLLLELLLLAVLLFVVFFSTTTTTAIFSWPTLSTSIYAPPIRAEGYGLLVYSRCVRINQLLLHDLMRNKYCRNMTLILANMIGMECFRLSMTLCRHMSCVGFVVLLILSSLGHRIGGWPASLCYHYSVVSVVCCPFTTHEKCYPLRLFVSASRISVECKYTEL